MGEFELIQRYFKRSSRQPQTRLGIGDDCALLAPPPGEVIAATIDTLVENVHFLSGTEPECLGHKLLAVNFSDLAAMGAKPYWVLLAMTMPETDDCWLNDFARGLFGLAGRFNVELVGGDTTRGPLTFTLQALGSVPEKQALKRSGARPGDDIFVSGPLGEAALGLKMLKQEVDWKAEGPVRCYLKPEPRVEAGLGLRGIASACIDISDGLAADLGHLVMASGSGALIEWDSLPLSRDVRRYLAESGDWRLPLMAGDDYELCFTAAPDDRDRLALALQKTGVAWHRIGTIQKQPGLRLLKEGEVTALPAKGYQHF